jgi:hypothetical protein
MRRSSSRNVSHVRLGLGLVRLVRALGLRFERPDEKNAANPRNVSHVRLVRLGLVRLEH